MYGYMYYVIQVPIVHDRNASVMSIKCRGHITSSFVLLDLLLLLTYLYGMFIFRFQQPEDLSGLTQKVHALYTNTVYIYICM